MKARTQRKWQLCVEKFSDNIGCNYGIADCGSFDILF